MDIICPEIIKSGVHKGEVCNRITSNGRPFCYRHYPNKKDYRNWPLNSHKGDDESERRGETDESERRGETDDDRSEADGETSERRGETDESERQCETEESEKQGETDDQENDKGDDESERRGETDESERRGETDESERRGETDESEECSETDKGIGESERQDETDDDKTDELENVHKQFNILKNIFQPVQRSPEWHEARRHRLTASDLASALLMTKHEINLVKNNIVASTKKLGHGCGYSSKKELIKKKCGAGKPFTGSTATRWGQKYEQIATQLYEKRVKEEVHEFGLLPHPTIGFLGASPDGIRACGVMLEIKFPYSRTITGIPSLHYWMQMQLQLEVCDLDICDFLECTLKEYYDEREYLNDVHPDDPRLTSRGLEKGIIIQIYTTDRFNSSDWVEPYYVYPDLGTPEEVNEWIDNWMKEKLSNNPNDWVFGKKKARKVYWSLEVYSMVSVKRDKEWFNARLPDLDAFWKEVLHYREVGLDGLLTPPRSPRKSVTIKTGSFSNSLIRVDG